MPDKLVILVGGTMMYIEAILKGLSEVPIIDENVRQAVREKFQNMPVEDAFVELSKIDERYVKIIDKSNKQRILRALEVALSTGKSILDFWEKDDDKGTILKDFEVKKYVKQIDRDELYKRIDTRFDKMMQFGALEEARALYEFSKEHNLPKAIGLYELFEYFDGKISLDVAIEKAKQNSRHYAKRQLTWMRNRFNDFEVL
jgi:tRNA dimethylallyltransferase